MRRRKEGTVCLYTPLGVFVVVTLSSVLPFDSPLRALRNLSHLANRWPQAGFTFLQLLLSRPFFEQYFITSLMVGCGFHLIFGKFFGTGS